MQYETTQQIIEPRGDNCLLFSLVNPFLHNPKKVELFQSLRKKERCDLALVAIIPNSPFSILFSRTIQVVELPCHQHNHSRQSLSLVRIVVRYTITLLEHWYRWGILALPNEPSKVLSVEQFHDFVGKVSLHSPLSQEYIMVHRDRACLVFHEWQERIKGKSAWHTPLAFVATLTVTLLTSTFKDFSWISAGTLRGMCSTFLVVSWVWLIWEIKKAWQSRSASPENFIADLAKGTKQTDYAVPSKSSDAGTTV
ncbi:MAG: hypothetical protein LAO78_03430 [Acidobacteriia bacterium]|nr:hypothetical protein [Terriglobia bacterium]